MLIRCVPPLLMALCLVRCGNAPGPKGGPPLREGPWHMVLDLNGEPLPVHFELDRDSIGNFLTLHNGEERILVREIRVEGDSVRIRMPLFDTELLAVREGDSVITGVCVNHLRKTGEDRIGFRAEAGPRPRFDAAAPKGDIDGNWEAHFSPGTAEEYPALGIFHQQNGIITGTFGTETGDYRFLEGALDGDTLRLSAFSGAQAHLFKACLRNDSLIGRFWSGVHWSEPWIAYRNESFRLRDPDSLTVLKEGADMVDLRFTTIDGRAVSTADARDRQKPLLVQIMGSWCGNCVDESVMLDELYAKYHAEGLEVVAIAFEKQREPARAIEGLKRFRDVLGVDYPIAYAGDASKENTRVKLPFLDRIMSYPTCVFIDRQGKVRKVHTGFYGPGTGEFYHAYKRDLEAFVQQLLAEAPALAQVR